MFTLTITAATADELREKVTAAQPKGGSPLAVFTNEVLLEELRARLRKDNLLVNVQPFASETVSTCDAAPQVAKPTSSATKRTKRETEEQAKPAAPQETPKTVQAETATAQAMAAPATSKADVVAALEAFAKAYGGQVAARQVMSTFGSTKLADIAEDKWPALVSALAVAPQTVAA